MREVALTGPPDGGDFGFEPGEEVIFVGEWARGLRGLVADARDTQYTVAWSNGQVGSFYRGHPQVLRAPAG